MILQFEFEDEMENDSFTDYGSSCDDEMDCELQQRDPMHVAVGQMAPDGAKGNNMDISSVTENTDWHEQEQERRNRPCNPVFAQGDDVWNAPTRAVDDSERYLLNTGSKLKRRPANSTKETR